MPPEPSVTSASCEPLLCTLRYSSALLPKSFERPGPKSVSPAMNCSGDEVVVWWRWIVDMRVPYLDGVTSFMYITPISRRSVVRSVATVASQDQDRSRRQHTGHLAREPAKGLR